MAVDKASIIAKPPLIAREDRHTHDQRRRLFLVLSERVSRHGVHEQERDRASHYQSDEDRFLSCEDLHRLSPVAGYGLPSLRHMHSSSNVRVEHWLVIVSAITTSREKRMVGISLPAANQRRTLDARLQVHPGRR